MMRRYLSRGKICIVICLMLGLYFFRAGIQHSQALRTAERNLSLICDEGLTAERAEELLREDFQQDSEKAGEEAVQGESLYPVFWTEIKAQRVENKELERSEQVDVIYAVGNTELLCGEGNLLQPGDTSGCLLDENTTKKLFGYGDPSGSKIVFNGREYEIRGVIKSQKNTLMIQITKNTADDTVLLNRITTGVGDRQPEILQETIQNRYGVSGNRMEWGLLYGILRAALLLFPLSVALILILRIKEKAGKSENRKEKTFWELCLVTMILCVGICITKQIQIPSDMIPSAWSDFDFFAQLWEEKKEALRLLVETEKSATENQYFESFFRGMICAGTSLTVTVFSYRFF